MEIEEDLGEAYDAPVPESQCGSTLDFQHVESYRETLGVPRSLVTLKQGPVGNHVQGGLEWCSGTLIARDLFLSAGHCNYAVGDEVWFEHQLDAAGNARAPVVHDVVAVVEQQNGAGLDYAVVRLNGTPGRTYGYSRLADDEASVNQVFGQPLTVIGHPDVPGTNYKVVSVGPFLTGASTLGSNWFLHQADTLGGNSGSGVIRRDGQLVGVHTNAGCDTVDPPSQGNSAMRMTVLLDSSATLRQVASMQGVSFADLDGSGAVDAAVVNFSGVTARTSDGSAFVDQADWTTNAFFGDRGTFFADVTGDGLADAIAVNNARVTIRRSNGSSFNANENWTNNPYFGSLGTYFADVTGDGRADAIAFNGTITVRRSTGTSFSANESWTTDSFVGALGNAFADVTGDGRADAIAVRENGVFVRRANAAGTAFGATETWTSNRFFGAFGTYFADATGDGRADLIGVNNGVTTIRRSNGNGFNANENWTTTTHTGSLGTTFADANGDGMADSITVQNDSVSVRLSTGTSFGGGRQWVNVAYYGAL